MPSRSENRAISAEILGTGAITPITVVQLRVNFSRGNPYPPHHSACLFQIMFDRRFGSAAIFQNLGSELGVLPWCHRTQSIRSKPGISRETDPHRGARAVDDTRCLNYFLQPSGTFHRQ